MYMKVRQLIEMLKTANQDAPVYLLTLYEEDGQTEVTGMVYNKDEVTLTDEHMS